MKTHKLLHSYRHLPNYAEIAQAAASWAKANPHATPDELMAWVAAAYPTEAMLTIAEEPAPFVVFGEPEKHIPINAIEQMQMVMRLPVAQRGALMPDAHLGYAMPIGGVVSLDDAISPSFVGYDISCMMQLSLFDLTPQEFMKHRRKLAGVLRSETRFGLGADFKPGQRQHAVMDDPRWSETRLLRSLKTLAGKQLGSSGGGNHFADLVIVDFVRDHESYRAGDQAVGLLTHSGSRGAGHKTATYYVEAAAQYIRQVATGIPSGYEWLPLDTELGQEYLSAMQLMGAYARANHDLIHDHFVASAGLGLRHRVWNRHNYAWIEEEGVIHRKGATPAEKGMIGLIPGSSGTASYLVRGLGNEPSLHSSSHGAGRWFSRAEAKRRHDEGAFLKHMAALDILHFGLEPDETFLAYKDIEMVIALQEGLLIEVIARMTPKVVLMGGKSDDGD
ncbi:MAG: RNA-splicing ligase RtcB [Chloroflexota bacterium]|jgi:tRNA-splicing ligase RtcB|nr:RtcB family protein [Caldilinea sp.]GIK75719.1 MAG: RNA-splicing ligase RtcB [Chloroflexota bacterium]